MLNPNFCTCPKCCDAREAEDPKLAKAVKILADSLADHNIENLDALEGKIVHAINSVIDEHHGPIAYCISKRLEDVDDEDVRNMVVDMVDAMRIYQIAKPLLNEFAARKWSLGECARYIIDAAHRSAERHVLSSLIQSIQEEGLHAAAKSMSEDN